MNKTIRIASLLLAISATSVQTVEAQGMGPIRDWIGKLSGPGFGWGFGFHVYSPVFGTSSERGAAANTATNGIRVQLIHDFAPREAAQTSGSIIKVKKVRIKFEFPLAVSRRASKSVWKHLDIEVAPMVSYTRYWFSGDVDPFQHSSFSAGLQFRFHVVERIIFVKVGPAVHFFPPFETTDFDPLILDNDVSRTGFERVAGFTAGLDIDLHGLCRAINWC